MAASATSAPVLSAVRRPIFAAASGAQLGVPRPNRAGTHHGAVPAGRASAPGLITGHSSAPSTPSRRSQVVTEPALGTKPSSAYVVSWPICQAQLDTTPAGAAPGGLVPALHHRNAPVPMVSFAIPSRTHWWPNSAACWSPTIAPIVARPPQTDASVTAIRPALGSTSGSICAGTPNRLSIDSSQHPLARSKSMVLDAIDGSVTCAAPPLSRQVSQHPTSPKSSRPRAAAARAPSSSSSSQLSFDAANAASSGSPVLARTAASWPAVRSFPHAPAVRVSRQLMAGQTG